MTRLEAIKNLKLIKKQFRKYDFTFALDMAIKALEEAEERSHYNSGLDMIVEQKIEADKKWKETQTLFEEHEDCLNHKDCSTCDRFGIDCGTCEVSEDD